ncbi:MAG: 50S ribosomal protein L25 [Mariniblastus sp.]
MADTLTVVKREQTGSLRMKRLRQSGRIPAVLYGHGEGNVLLSVCEKELNKAINHGSHIVSLAGEASDTALIKDVQWDAFGMKVIHIDFTRVDATEAVEVTLSIELKGDATGTHHGGVINFHQHQLAILCPANAMQEKLTLNISDLDVDQSYTAADVPLPAGAKLAEDGTTPIVSCALPTEQAEEETAEAAAEPESPAE